MSRGFRPAALKPPEKRRNVWINDDDWAALREKADLHGVSISAYIRAATVGGGFVVPEALLRDPAFQAFRPAPKPSQKR